MKIFTCAACDNTIYFENSTCLHCDSAIGFLPSHQSMATLTHTTNDAYTAVGGTPTTLRYCSNRVHGACNWLTEGTDAEALCLACELNRTIPNLDEKGSLPAWRAMEMAKKRLIYSLLRFGLPLESAFRRRRLAFDFLRKATTGHQEGLITVDIKEADPVERERQRVRLHEPYRSLLGHLRHESGHFYWMLLVEDGHRQKAFRALFGDEREDYAKALAEHHASGPPTDWQSRFVSAYASAHPWEDWAETWAHYLHIVDTIDTAEASGIEPRAAGIAYGSAWLFKAYDNYREETYDALMERWVPLTVALNNLTRSMGHNDFYPFVIPVAAHSKLRFVHDLVRSSQFHCASAAPSVDTPPTLAEGSTTPNVARRQRNAEHHRPDGVRGLLAAILGPRRKAGARDQRH